jgi:DNA-binding response OmpR family regulator
MVRILLVDDDVELSSMLREYLLRDHFAVEIAHDGETGIRRALSGEVDIAVLDVMMPGVDGIEALRRIRAESRIPVLMLTAKGDDVDRIVGLELGADDYVPKPCTPRELAARVRAILRRVQGDGSSAIHNRPLSAGPLSLWPEKRSALWEGSPLELTSTEFNLLEVLVRNAGRVVSKQELSERALGRPLARYDRSVDVHMSAIRQKLRALSPERALIETVRGLGYQFIKE